MALKTFVTGEVLTASDTNVYLKNTIPARKTATESVTSSTTLQDDDHLTVTAAANSEYEATLVLFYDGATAGDLKIALTLPSGNCNFATTRLSTPATGTGSVVLDTWDGTAFSVGCLGAGTTCAFVAHGVIAVSATGGAVTLQWAQNTSDGTATRLFAKSYLVLRRIH